MNTLSLRSNFWLSLLVVGLSVILISTSCKQPVVDADFTASATGKRIQNDVIEADTSGNPLKLRWVLEGSGTSDLLGDFQVTVAGDTDVAGGTSTVKINLVTSPGDTIRMDGQSQDKPDGSFTATETITGGTGKFAKVSGTSTTTGKSNPEAGEASWDSKGVISY